MGCIESTNVQLIKDLVNSGWLSCGSLRVWLA